MATDPSPGPEYREENKLRMSEKNDNLKSC